MEPVDGSVAFLSKPSLDVVPSASACDRPIADSPCCDLTVMARNWATSTENPLLFGGSAVGPFGCIPTVPPICLPYASTPAPARYADAQPKMVSQQRTGQKRVHDVAPAVDSAQEKSASSSTHVGGITQQRPKVCVRTIFKQETEATLHVEHMRGDRQPFVAPVSAVSSIAVPAFIGNMCTQLVA